MNLIQAVRSGKKFYRKCWLTKLPITSDELESLRLSKELLLADDWEIEREPILITASEFDEAVRRTGNLYYEDQWHWAAALKKELGL